MSSRCMIGALGILAICAMDVLPAQAQAKPPRDLLMGHDVRLELKGGASAAGELLGVTSDSLSILGPTGALRTMGFDQIVEMDVARHSFGWRKVWTWTALGAAVSGLGLTAACQAYEGSDGCGAVFVGVALSWGLTGGLLGAVMNAQRWRMIAPGPETARPFARYPQGMPDDSRVR